MQKNLYITLFSILFSGLIVISCTEPFELETTDFSDILVINASITNETKAHEIYISRSFISGEEPQQVSGAAVSVLVEGEGAITFREVEAGIYRSESVFAAVAGKEYTLSVTDENGERFVSRTVMLTQPSVIDNVSARRVVNEQDNDGVEIYVDGTGLGDHSGYFRYTFEETYRIESFYKPTKELIVVSESSRALDLVDKENEERVCYVYEPSNTIVIAETRNLAENKVRDYPVQFIERRDRKVALRYSILVKQHSLSLTSYEFYETLKEFSSSSNLFSQTQPGLIVGNIKHESNPDIKVIGLFETVSVSEKRIFFNFRDIFGNDRPFLESCESEAYSLNNPELFSRINSGQFQFTGEDPPGFYNIAQISCIDCTLKGSNVIPEFWTED